LYKPLVQAVPRIEKMSNFGNNNNNNNNNNKSISLSVCQQRVACNKQALKLYITNGRLRPEVKSEIEMV
jgi:hypothetical protein